MAAINYPEGLVASTQIVGEQGQGNIKIGGTPALTYFDYVSRGRGEVLRLLFVDAGVSFKDTRWSFPGWAKLSQADKDYFDPNGSLPFVFLDGEYLTQSYPTLRKLARQLGDYDGETPAEVYWVDRLTDIGSDWRASLVNSVMSTSEAGFLPIEDDHAAFMKHKNFAGPRFAAGFEKQLESSEYRSKGPYILGDRVTYADFVLWQIIHDEIASGVLSIDDKPLIKAFYNAVENRPRIAAYHKSEKYFG